jgi:hypothetical protein
VKPLLKFLLLGFVVSVLLLLVACVPASAPGGANCQNGICVDIQLVEPVRFDQPVTATITIETDRDIARLGVSLGDLDPNVPVEGPRSWQTDVKAHQPVTFTGTVRFIHEGYFGVTDAAATYEGRRVEDYVSVYVTRAGGTLNPVIPTGPAIAVPQPTIAGSTSPMPTPPPPDGPPTLWNRSLPGYTPNEVVTFCGWQAGQTSGSMTDMVG